MLRRRAQSGGSAIQGGFFCVRRRNILRFCVRVGRLALSVSFPQTRPQRNHHQLDALGGLCMPTDNALRHHIDDDCDVSAPVPAPNIREIHHPGRFSPGAVKLGLSRSPEWIPVFTWIVARMLLCQRIPASQRSSGDCSATDQRVHLAPPIETLGGHVWLSTPQHPRWHFARCHGPHQTRARR